MNAQHSQLLIKELSRLREEERHVDFSLICAEIKTNCHKVVLAIFSQRVYDVCLGSHCTELNTKANADNLIEKLYKPSYDDTKVDVIEFLLKIAKPAEELGIEILIKSKKVTTWKDIQRERLQVFSKQMIEFWHKEKFTDVVLHVSGKEFRCHKAVLAAMSPYFDAMFMSGMKETGKNAIELHGFDKKTVGKVIGYIYTGDCAIDNNNADLILTASVYFQVKPLQRLCERFLASHIDPDNCIDLLSLAKSCSCEILINDVINFMKKTIMKLFRNSSFTKLNYETLVVLVSSDDLLVSEESSVLDIILQWFDGQESKDEEALLTLLEHIECPQIKLENLQHICETNKYLQQYPLCKQKLLDAERGNAKSGKFRNDEVLLVVRPNTFSDDVDIVCYSFGQNSWFSLNKIIKYKAGSSPGVCFHEKNVFISGGSGNLKNFIRYDCYKNEWHKLPGMKRGRFGHCMCGTEMGIFVIGGKRMSHDSFNSIEKYRLDENIWSEEGTLLTPVSDASCACVESRIFVFGGSQSAFSFTHAIQYYDIKTKNCTQVSTFPKGVLTGIMRICWCEDYFYHVTAEGKVLQSDRTYPCAPEPRYLGTIQKRLMMTGYSVVYYKDSILLVSDTKTAQGESKVIQYGISENKRLLCDIKQIPFPPDSNQYFAVITNISKKFLISVLK
ncbi:kelch-like protein 24 [Saccostrea cucullata]|uniref:kelch-like protein 24 n=1 Tax=Saccostrea cuccullata TaxID=36930 RepID=UPI002ED3E9F6